VLVNNVGGLYGTRWETADGYEATLAMNFLGPFTLTYELLPLLDANAPARCINVVSAAFKMRKGDPFQDLQSTQHFIGGDAYALAKLLNVLFSLALAKRLTGARVRIPGNSSLSKNPAAETTPSTPPSSSTTGTALSRCSASRPTSSLNGVAGPTVTTWVVITACTGYALGPPRFAPRVP
jgi:NAD(P)-dependent dehydrogenase (short-subunit alcohol dehydrogenase family)